VSAPSVLEIIERYYDAVPRPAARVETIGPFELFINVSSGWPYYARPRLGAAQFSAADVERVRTRQRELQVPESFEWVAETTPALCAAVEAGGLNVHMHPLLLLDALAHRTVAVDGVDVRLVTPDDDLARFGAVPSVAFTSPGTDVGSVGTEALAVAARKRSAESVEFQRQRLLSGRTVSAVALIDGEPVAMGSHQPLGGVSEIVGIGTLPAFRRRGLAAAITVLLVEDGLRRGVATIFLSAGDDAIARVYERVGFKRTATACIADSPYNGA
jgi:ribosomal protein S18 acetylase RimI-like enzyme